MSDTFDPYYQWLGIRDPERPPNHYRLLGVDLLEMNEEVIHTAADRQMAHVRTFQNGPHGQESQRLLNELAAAKLCLLDPDKRDIYNDWLAARLEHPASALPGHASPIPAINVALSPVALRQPGRSTRDKSQRTRWIAFAVVPLVTLLGGLVGYRLYRDHHRGLPLHTSSGSNLPIPSVVPPAAEPDEFLPQTSNVVPNDADQNTQLPGPAPSDESPDPTASGSPASNRAPSDSVPSDDASTAGAAIATAGPSESETPANAETGTDGSASSNAADSDSVTAPETAAVPPSGDPLTSPASLPKITRWADLPAANETAAASFRISDPLGSPLTLLANRDLVASRSALQSLLRNPSPVTNAAQVRDAEMILVTLDQFWSAVAERQMGGTG